MPAPANESARHWELKRAAASWALHQGFDLVAAELRLPRTPYRADLVGCLLSGSEPVLTAVFECKQSRADLLQDSRSISETRSRIEELQSRLDHLTRLLGLHYPNLRQGEELFPQFETRIHAEKIGHAGYARTERQLRSLQRHLHAGTKFDKVLGWNLIDLHYLVVEKDILRGSEIPEGWGLLVRENDQLTLQAAPRRCGPEPKLRQELLAAMARQGTHRTLREMNVPSWNNPVEPDESTD